MALAAGNASGVSVIGLAAQVSITGGEAANHSLSINAFDGDDVVEAFGRAASAITFLADGGAGDDVLTGGTDDDVLIGGPGQDILDGAPAQTSSSRRDRANMTALLRALARVLSQRGRPQTAIYHRGPPQGGHAGRNRSRRAAAQRPGACLSEYASQVRSGALHVARLLRDAAV